MRVDRLRDCCPSCSCCSTVYTPAELIPTINLSRRQTSGKMPSETSHASQHHHARQEEEEKKKKTCSSLQLPPAPKVVPEITTVGKNSPQTRCRSTHVYMYIRVQICIAWLPWHVSRKTSTELFECTNSCTRACTGMKGT